MSEIWVAAAAAVVTSGIGMVAANNTHTDTPAARNLGGEIGNINQQLGGTTGDPSAQAINGLQTISGGNIDVPAFLAQHPEFQEGYDNNSGNDQAAWLRRAINDATYIDQASIPRTGGIGTIQNTLNTQNRAGNLLDVANGAGTYTNILHGANAGFYGQANNYTAAANQAVVPGEAQSAATANALRGYGSPLLTQMNAQAQAMGQPLSAPTSTTSASQQGIPAVYGNGDVDKSGNPIVETRGANRSTDGTTNTGSTLGFSNLQYQQNQIASDLLGQGGNLSPSELRNVQQSSRAGFAARGLDATNASVVDESFNTDAARRARLLQNLSTAQGIQNQGLAETTNQQNYGLNVNAANLNASALQNSALNQSAILAEQQRQAQINSMGDAARIQAMGNIDPYAAIINGTNPNNFGNAMSLYGQVNPSANALYGYGSDLNNTNYNAAASNANAAANNRAALYGAGINAAGSVAGAYISNRSATPPATSTPTYSPGNEYYNAYV